MRSASTASSPRPCPSCPIMTIGRGPRWSTLRSGQAWQSGRSRSTPDVAALRHGAPERRRLQRRHRRPGHRGDGARWTRPALVRGAVRQDRSWIGLVAQPASRRSSSGSATPSAGRRCRPSLRLGTARVHPGRHARSRPSTWSAPRSRWSRNTIGDLPPPDDDRWSGRRCSATPARSRSPPPGLRAGRRDARRVGRPARGPGRRLGDPRRGGRVGPLPGRRSAGLRNSASVRRGVVRRGRSAAGRPDAVRQIVADSVRDAPGSRAGRAVRDAGRPAGRGTRRSAKPVEVAQTLASWFGAGPIVVGPVVPDLMARSPRRARRSPASARRRPGRMRRDRCCRRAAARAVAVRRRSCPAAARSEVYGRSPRATASARHGGGVPRQRWLDRGDARALFVHANTVRYRLRRVGEITGYAPPTPRRRLHAARRARARPTAPDPTDRVRVL